MAMSKATATIIQSVRKALTEGSRIVQTQEQPSRCNNNVELYFQINPLYQIWRDNVQIVV